MPEPAMDIRAYREMKDVMGEVLHELIETFLDYMPEQIDDLSQAISAEEAEKIFHIAHRIKSSCNSIGALGMAESAETIELLGRAETTSGFEDHFNNLKTQMIKVSEFLRQELASMKG